MNALIEEASITYPSGIRRKQHMSFAHALSNDWVLKHCILGNIDAKDWVFLLFNMADCVLYEKVKLFRFLC